MKTHKKKFISVILVYFMIAGVVLGCADVGYARRVRGEGKLIGQRVPVENLPAVDSKWRSALEGFLKLDITVLGAIRIRVYKNGKIYLGKEIGGMLVDKDLAREWVEVKPVEFEDGVKGIEVWDGEDNVANFILSRDGEYVDYLQRCDRNGQLLISTGWREELKKFAKKGAKCPFDCIVKLTSSGEKKHSGRFTLYGLGEKIIQLTIKGELPGTYLRIHPVEFEDGVRGIEVWNGEDNVGNFILFKDGEYLIPPNRCTINGEFISDKWWRKELDKFGRAEKEILIPALAKVYKNGKIYLGEEIEQIYLGRELAGEWVEVRPVEFEEGVRGIEVWDGEDNVGNFILSRDGEYLIPPNRCTINGEFISDTWWWAELNKFVKNVKKTFFPAIQEVRSNGFLYLGRNIKGVYLGKDLAGEWVEVKPVEFEEGVRGIEVWDGEDNVVNFILSRDGEYLETPQRCNLEGVPIIDTGWRERLRRFLEHGGNLYSVLAKVYDNETNPGSMRILNDEEIGQITVSAELAGEWVEVRPVEFEEGVRGVQIWVGEEKERIPIVSWVLYRDGEFVKQRFPRLGSKYSRIMTILKKVRRELGPNFSFDEFKQKLKELTLSVEEWRLALDTISLGRYRSLEAPLSTEDDRNLLDVLPDEGAIDPEQRLIDDESVPPFEEWLNEEEFKILSLMFEGDYDILPQDVVDRKIARENGIEVEDIYSVRAKLEVILAFWNG